ncbi:MAG TPA: hypothetical protein DCW74_12770, partial [Alteromonas australica]|nr:hypothetical protein [Alteromonas australica]
FQDASGNNNHFSRHNLFDTDVVPDSPTNNFPTFNPLNKTGQTLTHSEGNLEVASSSFWSSSIWSRMTMAGHGGGTGKFYAEFVNYGSSGGGSTVVGIGNYESLATNTINHNDAIIYYYNQVRQNGTTVTLGGNYSSTPGISGNEVVRMAWDCSNGKVWIGGSQEFFDVGSGVGDPANGNNPSGTISSFAGAPIGVLHNRSTNTGRCIMNFGQNGTFNGTLTAGGNSDENGIGDFFYPVPSGFVALCASNLPDVTIGPGQDTQADDNFNTLLYTGDGNTSRSITGVGFAPDLVFIKSRSTAEDSAMSDTVRGASKKLKPNKGDAESTPATAVISAFGSDGFTGPASTPGNLNVNTRTYVAWNWKAGGAPSGDNSAAANAEPTAGSAKINGSNQSGAFSGSPSIAIKRLSANTTAGFSIVTWTGTGSAGTIPHGLGVAPDFYVVKNRDDDSTNWQAYHRSIANDAETDYIYLNDTAGSDDSDDWNDTAPTANVFSVKTHNQVNESGDDYLAYVFASIEGYSKFGSFAGNSADDGTFVYLGFRPAYIWLKRHDSGGVDWSLYDSKREGYNVDNDNLRAFAVSAATEQTDDDIDFLSNGFKCRRNFANNQGSVLFFAWAEAPFKFANAR